MSPKFLGIVSLLALFVASSAQAEPRKKGRGKGRSTKTDSSMTMVAPPSSLFDPPPVAPTPPPDLKPSPPPPESAPSADSPPDADADRPRISLLPLVLVGVEPRWEGRVFRQSEGMQRDLRRYGALGYPSVALTADLYPLANLKSKFLRGFGVTLQFSRAFGFESDSARLAAFEESRTPPVDTSFMRYAVGLRYRIHTNPESETPLVLGISASLRRWAFAFAPELPLGPDLEVPTADYQLGRFGFDAGLEVRKVTFYAAAYYLHAFSVAAPNTRKLDTATHPYLANAPAMGGEFRGAVGVRLAPWIELRLSVEYAITAFHLKALQEGDPPDRVLDSYLSAGLGPYVNF
ncbi:MAG TPA: hypothetical protein VK550_34225 [Polyangiaceae bacterium]|nr:hypothetical protein [Polyangiaceae bacterium]